MNPEDRDAWLDSFSLTLPIHLLETFLAEAAARPDEYPTITRVANEAYPDPAAWKARVRCYEPGIYHWQWADGSGFVPSDADLLKTLGLNVVTDSSLPVGTAILADARGCTLARLDGADESGVHVRIRTRGVRDGN